MTAVRRISVAEAYGLIRKIVGIPFSEISEFSSHTDLKTDKGLVGKVLELKLGIPNSNSKLDLLDGELKTNKCDPSGSPLQSIFISQISQEFDNIISGQTFEESYLWEKIKNLLYVPVCKEGETKDWFFLPPIVVDLKSRKYDFIRIVLAKDFSKIVDLLKRHIDSNGRIHTSNGTLMQIRSKDVLPYHPIFSKVYGKNVSNKNHAFYFRPIFGNFITSLSDEYPFRQLPQRSRIVRKKKNTG